MSEHVCNWRAPYTDEAKTQVGCRAEQEVSPSLANLCEFVPPSFAVPSSPSRGTDLITLVSIKKVRSIEIKNVDKGVVVEDADPRNMRTVVRRLFLLV